MPGEACDDSTVHGLPVTQLVQSRTMTRRKMHEPQKFDVDNNNNNTNKAPAVNIDDEQHDRGDWSEPALGRGVRPGKEGGLVLAVARYGTAGRERTAVLLQVLCAASPRKEKTSRLWDSAGDRLLVGLVNPAEGGNDAWAVPKIRDSKRR